MPVGVGAAADGGADTAVVQLPSSRAAPSAKHNSSSAPLSSPLSSMPALAAPPPPSPCELAPAASVAAYSRLR
eukprot:365308-Chlamydomonas_euryale.AAC.3